ncbi:CaiB/BaiF CoA transferase family protein [Shumkonia mesophila]|uniref:CaiB/BaiF CoA transferase family protein n=1 Tax=Shumkonia mesophila TaxID=2838854 RepID=UPI00293479CB|nr:CoA transferase [Shumkonia mesophila]
MSTTDSQRPTAVMAGPLNGITVVDLTRVLAGPYCTMVLSDLGARVIKVEPPGGDDSRHYGPFVDGESAYFASLNRGKESIALDLKAEADRALFERLLARADVVVENFRPGTMARLGYGWEALHERFPRLIYAAASGFGHSGPYSQRPAYDLVAQAMGGIMSLTGHPGGPPARVGTSIGDITAGLFATVGVAAALHQRQRTGQGMMIDVAMMDGQVAVLENALARYFATGQVPGPMGTRHPSITPFEAFATADGYIVVAAGNDALFARLCQAVGRPDLADDPRFASNQERTANVDALKVEMEKALRLRPTAEWLEALGAARLPCGPINTVDKVVADPQVAARAMVVSAEGASGRPLRMAGNPIKMSAFADPPTRSRVPRLDEDRARIVTDFAEE